MKTMTALACAMGAGMIAAPALGVPITYRATLADGDVATGSIPLPGDGNGVDNPETWHWYAFFAQAGDFVTVEVNRTTANLDPVSSTFFGGAGFGDLPGDTSPMFTIFDTPAGATWVASGDDEDPDPYGGPFSDPLYSFSAPSTGWYAVAIGNYLGLAGDGPYEIIVTGQTPTPGAAAALLLGAGAFCARRRR